MDLARSLNNVAIGLTSKQAYGDGVAAYEAAMEILGAAGLDHPDQLTPAHLFRRTSTSHFHSYEDIYELSVRLRAAINANEKE